MKIAPAKIEGFLGTLEKSGCFSVLIYGPDSGGVSNLANRIAGMIVKDINDPFSVTTIDNERIANEPSAVFDELSAMSFFGGKKLVMFKNAEGNKEITESIGSAITDIPQSAKESSFLLVTAGDLAATSALRKLYESSDDVAAIACYVADERDISAKATRIFSAKGLRATERSVIEFLAESCQGDSKIIESEIEKLELYLDGRKEVKLEDVLLTTGNTTETELQDICDLVCEGKKAEAEMMLKKGFDAGLQPIAVIRSLQRYIEKLHFCQSQIISERRSVEEAVASLRPPLFFKQVPTFKNHLNGMMRRPANDIWNAYQVLYKAEGEIKETGSEPELITSKAVSSIL